MRIGFTGTQHGTSKKQHQTLHDLLKHFSQLAPSCLDTSTILHHGDCIGADKEAHDLCLLLGISTHLHPPTKPDKRAFCIADNSEQELPYLERNHEIVWRSQFMIATPFDKEILRSGTWATIRYAHKTCRRYVYVIDRQGKILLLPPNSI